MLRLRHAGGAERSVKWLRTDRVRQVICIAWPLAGLYELTAAGAFDLKSDLVKTLSHHQLNNLTLWSVHPRELSRIRSAIFPKERLRVLDGVILTVLSSTHRHLSFAELIDRGNLSQADQTELGRRLQSLKRKGFVSCKGRSTSARWSLTSRGKME